MRTRHAALFALLSASAVWCGQSSPRPCDPRVLPGGISDLLKSNFEGWRIQTNEGLEPYDLRLWVASKQGACPGIASGRFFSPTKRSLAVLLVPESSCQRGLKVVAFKESGTQGTLVPIVIADVADQSGKNVVIYRLPPGVYTDPEHTRRIRIKLDGLQLERMEVSTTIYFWRANHFDHLVTSD